MAYSVAEVTMVCGHTNLYGVPSPKKGQPSWCHRCQAFHLVSKYQIIQTDNETITSYNKRVRMTQYLSNQPLNPHHYF